MTILRTTSRVTCSLLLAGVLVFACGIANAATLTIVNNNAAGVGFNDPTPRAPVGGNPGTTLGDQRLYIFQYAASIWGGLLPSSVTILIRSQFAAQTCTATSAVLGSAGPVTAHRDFANAEFAGTWYHQALANKQAGADLSPANPDINATFNLSIDAGCFGPGQVWYYGTDGNEGTNIELLPVVLHEMGHGLGFSTLTSGTSGNFNGGFPSLYDRWLLDKATGLHWFEETAGQRAASAISNGGLVWDGSATTTAALSYLSHRPRMVINSPGGIAGNYVAAAAGFGAPITAGGISGNVVLADDATGTTSDACEALVNAGAINGNIALIDRGTCTFVFKAQAAQAAGATALLIANNVAGPPQPPGGTDPSITIPVAGITQADGATIKANLAGGVNVTLDLDPVLLAGADNFGHPLMFTPNPFQSGSSVSHWDVSLNPNALMEPAINGSLHDNVDLTLNHFQDIGWFPRATATTLALFTAQGRGDGIALRWQFSDPSDVAVITLERAMAAEGPWSAISTELSMEGGMTVALDTNVEPDLTYFYRLRVVDRAGETHFEGLISGRRAGAFAGRTFLGAPSPNPSNRGASFTVRLAKPEFVRLSVVDASGRKVATIHEGMMPPGEFTRAWDGRMEHSGDAPAGIYFINLLTSEGKQAQRLALIR